MHSNRRPDTSSVRRIAILATTVLLGVLALPPTIQAQTGQFQVFPSCVLPPAPRENDTWPDAVTDSLGTITSASITFSGAGLLANDRGTALTLVSVGPTSSGGGTITGTDPFTFTVAAGFTGTDIFPYEISDAAGQTAIGLVKVGATGDTTFPSVSITAPAGGPVSGSVVVRALASDNIGVAGVRFFDGASQIGPEVTAPFETTWDTTLVANGDHNLTAVARDAAGNTTTSAVVVVTVSNAPPPPPPPAPTAGLVLSLGFDEASGDAIDSSTSARNGVITGAVRVPGKVGNALSFDGIDDWVTVTDGAAGTPLDLTTGMTIEAWVLPSAMSGWETVVLKELGVNLLSYALYANDGAPLGGFNGPAGYVRIGLADNAVQGVGPLSTTEWTHLATTYDGTMQRLYVNGVEVGARAQTGSMPVGNQPLRIGGNASFAGEFFEGLIDEVKVYNRALSASEIGADMGNVAPPPPPPPPPPPTPAGPVLALSFNEVGGAAANDSSGLANNGTIAGATRVDGQFGFGRALSFDGVASIVNVEHSASLALTTGMTLEAWVNPSANAGAAPNGGWRTVILKERGTDGLAYALYGNDGDMNPSRPAGYVHNGAGVGTDKEATSEPELPIGFWSHIAVTFDNDSIRLYVNGELRGELAAPGEIAASTSPLRIGGNNVFSVPGTEFFAGLIDEVRVYNRALSAAEITTDMNTPLP
jgi:hypothetical protein